MGEDRGYNKRRIKMTMMRTGGTSRRIRKMDAANELYLYHNTITILVEVELYLFMMKNRYTHKSKIKSIIDSHKIIFDF